MRKTILLILLIILVGTAFGKTARPFATADTLRNSYIKIACGQDGRFTIGTADGRKLLYGFPNEGSTSHTIVRIDDSSYIYNTVGGVVTTIDTLHQEGNALVITRRFGYPGYDFNIEVTQRLVIVNGPTSGRPDNVKIEYYIVNRDTVSHSVGILLELDTEINNNDYAPIATSFGYTGVEQDFTAPRIPQYWQAFEESPTQPESLLIGQGTLIGYGAVMPDRFCLGPWPVYNDVTWEYTSSGERYGDSAVLLWWYPVTLASGASRTVATLYGIGSGVTVTGNLGINLTAPLSLGVEHGSYVPNPFEVNALVINNTGRVLHNVTATINLPAGLSLAAGDSATKHTTPVDLDAGGIGSVSWRVIAASRTTADSLRFSVTASADTFTTTAYRSIFIPALEESIGGVMITVTGVDASSFPTIRVFCIVADPTTHMSISGLDESNFVVHEDGIHETPITVSMMSDTTGGGKADIAFLFDVTGSMGGYITGMKNKTIEFADSLVASGLDYRLALVTFYDTVGETHDFTDDANEFKGWISGLHALGGGDTPENALEAIRRATTLSWRSDAQHIMILITDAPYHQFDWATSLTTDSVLSMLAGLDCMTFVVGHDDTDQHRLANETGGMWFPIGSDFTNIITRIGGIISTQYVITYTTHNPVPDNRWRHVLVDVNYHSMSDSDSGRYWVGGYGLFFDPETTYTRGGLRFRLDVMVNSLRDVNDVHFIVNYDSSKVACDSAKAGEFLARGAEPPLSVITLGSGNVDISLTRRGSTTGVSGSGVLASLYFTAIAHNPTSRVWFSDVVVRDHLGIPIDPSIDTFAYIVYLSGAGHDTSCMLCDFDCDGDIDTRDFTLLGTYWQPTNDPNGDVGPATGTAPALTPHPDGVVNYEDLFVFGRMWNWYHLVVLGHPRIVPTNAVVSVVGDGNKVSVVGYSLPPVGMAHFVLKFNPEQTKIVSTALGNALSTGFVDVHDGTVEISAIRLARDGESPEVAGDVSFCEIVVEGKPVLQLVECDLRNGDAKSVAAQVINALVPEKLAVSVAPNPFNPVASISVAVPEEGFLSVNIVDMSSRVVSNLYSGPASAGIQELKWNASDAPAGIYFVHVKLSGSSVIKRIVLVK